TFESFPGLRRALHDLIDSLAGSPNRFVLTSRYTARAVRLLRDRSSRFEVVHVPPIAVEDAVEMLGLATAPRPSVDPHESEYTARTVQSLGDGRASYVGALADELQRARERGGPGGADTISALVALLGTGGRLSQQCNFSYELRLHRARGYGALKAIL